MGDVASEFRFIGKAAPMPTKRLRFDGLIGDRRIFFMRNNQGQQPLAQ